MKGLRVIGDYAAEFLVITLLVAASALSVIFLVPVLVGVTGYFSRELDARRFRDIFTTIGKNWKVIVFYTIFQLIIIVFPVLNIYFFNTHPDKTNNFVLAISVIALLFGTIYLATSPTVIVNMNVKFRQLLYNGFMMLFGSLWRSIISVLLLLGIVALTLTYPYVLVLTLYIVPMTISKLMKENFYKLKAKALNTSVEQLKRKEKEDDYLDEKGAVKPADIHFEGTENSAEGSDGDEAASEDTDEAASEDTDEAASEDTDEAASEDTDEAASEESGDVEKADIEEQSEGDEAEAAEDVDKTNVEEQNEIIASNTESSDSAQNE